MVFLRDEKYFKPRPQSRLVPLLSSFQNFRRAPQTFSYGSSLKGTTSTGYHFQRDAQTCKPILIYEFNHIRVKEVFLPKKKMAVNPGGSHFEFLRTVLYPSYIYVSRVPQSI